MNNCLLECIGWYHSSDERELCHGNESAGNYLFKDLRDDTGLIRSYLKRQSASSVILYSDRPGYFLAVLVASILSGLDVYLPGFEGWSPDSSGSDNIFTDALFLGNSDSGRYSDIKALLSDNSAEDTQPGNEVQGSRIIFLTSGSTGEPRQIIKTSLQLANEVEVLARLWGQAFNGVLTGTTVSHQHLYGFLFSIFLPLSSGGYLFDEKIEYPESLNTIPGENNVLISSPAFLSRLLAKDTVGNLSTVFSSGGPLSCEAAAQSEKLFKTAVYEVFGSTETGGIAYRRIAKDASWKAFEGIELSSNSDGRLLVVSEYLVDRTPFVSQDLVEFGSDGSFVLKGRADSIVKIEEKRVSLHEMADRLMELDWIESAILIPVGNEHQRLGVVIIPDKNVLNQILKDGRKTVVADLKEYIRRFYPPVLIPRKWRFLSEMPMNEMGKISRPGLEVLFRSMFSDFNCEIFRRTDIRLDCVLSFPENHRFFEGHFTENPILPGVSQVYTVLQLAERYLGIHSDCMTIPRIKFARLVKPYEKLILHMTLKHERSTLSYTLNMFEDDSLASKGSIRLSGNHK